MTLPEDIYYMTQALALAKQGLYTTTPNPRVGCVIVKQGHLLAQGWHAYAGEGHAEVQALKQTTQAQGATVYVTLEPCSHHGKTPPCCAALIQAQVARVVVAMQDPNPLVSGQGLAALRAAGITVVCGVLEQEARALNPGFIQRMTTGRPWVRSKLAMSLDGRTAMANGESHWITSIAARQDVHHYRAQSCAIMTGINTVLTDNPSLNARLPDVTLLQPTRIILDSHLNTPCHAKMATLAGETWVLTCSANREKQQRLEQQGFKIYLLPAEHGRLSLTAVFDFLGQQQINEVFIEAGAVLNGALLAGHWVDEWIIYMATCILGDQGRGLFTLPDLHRITDKKTLKLQELRQIGTDLRMILR